MATKRRLVTAQVWKSAPTDERGDLGIIKSVSSSPEVLAPDVVAKMLEKAGLDVPSDRDRVLLWTVSTEVKDRERDCLMQRGWKLKHYRNNPVVMWGHNYSSPPIGRSLDTFVDDGGKSGAFRLRMAKQFTEAQDNDFGHMIYRLSLKGYLRAASVGFYPIDSTEMKNEKGEPDGFRFNKSELLESSVVPIPCNPEALQGAKSLDGIDLAPYIPWAEKILDSRDEYAVSEKTIERIRIVAGAAKALFVIDEGDPEMARVKTDEENAEKKTEPTDAEKKAAEEKAALEVKAKADEAEAEAKAKKDAEAEGSKGGETVAPASTLSLGAVKVEVGAEAKQSDIASAAKFLTSLLPTKTKTETESTKTVETESDNDDGGIDISTDTLFGIIGDVFGASASKQE